MGGAGKTPTTIALAKHLLEKGYSPHILSRGYGARIKAPTLVNTNHHKASEVGDEPLLLAQVAPTWVYKDRLASGKLAIKAGADILLMDDGFQNPHLYKDCSLLVVDGKQGFGNGFTFPAGPLRENVEQGLSRADGVIFIGADEHRITESLSKPILTASIKPTNSNPKKVLAFTGLGFPEKFYQTLLNLGYDVVQTKSFPDHHPYKAEEIGELLQSAQKLNARLITTEKDLLRISDEYHKNMDVLKIELVFDKMDSLQDIMRKISL